MYQSPLRTSGYNPLMQPSPGSRQPACLLGVSEHEDIINDSSSGQLSSGLVATLLPNLLPAGSNDEPFPFPSLFPSPAVASRGWWGTSSVFVSAAVDKRSPRPPLHSPPSPAKPPPSSAHPPPSPAQPPPLPSLHLLQAAKLSAAFHPTTINAPPPTPASVVSASAAPAPPPAMASSSYPMLWLASSRSGGVPSTSSPEPAAAATAAAYGVNHSSLQATCSSGGGGDDDDDTPLVSIRNPPAPAPLLSHYSPSSNHSASYLGTSTCSNYMNNNSNNNMHTSRSSSSGDSSAELPAFDTMPELLQALTLSPSPASGRNVKPRHDPYLPLMAFTAAHAATDAATAAAAMAAAAAAEAAPPPPASPPPPPPPPRPAPTTPWVPSPSSAYSPLFNSPSLAGASVWADAPPARFVPPRPIPAPHPARSPHTPPPPLLPVPTYALPPGGGGTGGDARSPLSYTEDFRCNAEELQEMFSGTSLDPDAAFCRDVLLSADGDVQAATKTLLSMCSDHGGIGGDGSASPPPPSPLAAAECGGTPEASPRGGGGGSSSGAMPVPQQQQQQQHSSGSGGGAGERDEWQDIPPELLVDADIPEELRQQILQRQQEGGGGAGGGGEADEDALASIPYHLLRDAVMPCELRLRLFEKHGDGDGSCHVGSSGGGCGLPTTAAPRLSLSPTHHDWQDECGSGPSTAGAPSSTGGGGGSGFAAHGGGGRNSWDGGGRSSWDGGGRGSWDGNGGGSGGGGDSFGDGGWSPEQDEARLTDDKLSQLKIYFDDATVPELRSLLDAANGSVEVAIQLLIDEQEAEQAQRQAQAAEDAHFAERLMAEDYSSSPHLQGSAPRTDALSRSSAAIDALAGGGRGVGASGWGGAAAGGGEAAVATALRRASLVNRNVAVLGRLFPAAPHDLLSDFCNAPDYDVMAARAKLVELGFNCMGVEWAPPQPSAGARPQQQQNAQPLNWQQQQQMSQLGGQPPPPPLRVVEVGRPPLPARPACARFGPRPQQQQQQQHAPRYGAPSPGAASGSGSSGVHRAREVASSDTGYSSSDDDSAEEGDLLSSAATLTNQEVHDITQRLYERHRRKAVELERQRDELFAASRAAYTAGDRSDAKSLSYQANALRPRINAAHAKAANNIFAKRQALCINTWTVDLHALHEQEALEQLQRTLAKLNDPDLPSKKVVRVITGRGNHSNGPPKLLLAVRAWLEYHGHQFKDGIGYYDVYLDAPSRTAAALNNVGIVVGGVL